MLQSRALGAMHFNHTGVRVTSAEGSKQEGLRRFKVQFGGELVAGYMWKYCFNKTKYGLYNIAVRLLRGGDVVDQVQREAGDVDAFYQASNLGSGPAC
jgi:lipid II:glycine glycyltransferase (peptidoglycan interpeptide bridge formation enzyme)